MDIDSELADIEELSDEEEGGASFDTSELDEIDLGDVEGPGGDLEEAPGAPAEAQAPPQPQEQPAPRESEAAELPDNLREEIKSVLSYMDQLLEALPEEKIQEFAQSEHFEVYKRLFEELGLEN